jgi:hypothetical protein
MIPNERRLNLAMCAAASLLLASPAMGLNARSWVSHDGKDQNDCTIDHPCRTFQRAHDATAGGGEVDVLDPGNYGGLIINRSITIDGGGMGYVSVDVVPPPLDQNAGIVVVPNFGATVVLRRLFVVPPPSPGWPGISWIQGATLEIENVTIGSFAYGIQVYASGNTDGRTVQRQLFIKDTMIQNLAGSQGAVGINIDQGSNITMTAEELTIENAGTANTVGVGMQIMSGKAHISHSIFSGMQEAVFVTQGAELTLEDSTVAFTKSALRTFANGFIWVAGNNIHDNVVALTPSGGPINSFGNNRIAGNGSGEAPSGVVALK